MRAQPLSNSFMYTNMIMDNHLTLEPHVHDSTGLPYKCEKTDFKQDPLHLPDYNNVLYQDDYRDKNLQECASNMMQDFRMNSNFTPINGFQHPDRMEMATSTQPVSTEGLYLTNYYYHTNRDSLHAWLHILFNTPSRVHFTCNLHFTYIFYGALIPCLRIQVSFRNELSLWLNLQQQYVMSSAEVYL